MPKISVLIPVYNAAAHLREALDSILAQTFTDWELLAVSEYGSDDGSREILLEYSRRDPRIQVVQNAERLGLAESLNEGMRLAVGEYIARLDADDVSHPQRLQKQADFLDTHPGIGICGTWQHHFGLYDDWVHKTAADPAQCRANLIFTCDLCHSTVMLRRELFLKNGLFYDPDFYAEDFELWSRAMLMTQITNLPEVLGEYRCAPKNRTDTVLPKLWEENGRIVAATLRRTLSLEVSEDLYPLLNGWKNIFREQKDGAIRGEMLGSYRSVLQSVWEKNLSAGFYGRTPLLNTLRDRWIWANYDLRLEEKSGADSIEDVFSQVQRPLLKRYRQFRERDPSFRLRAKKVLRKFAGK